MNIIIFLEKRNQEQSFRNLNFILKFMDNIERFLSNWLRLDLYFGKWILYNKVQWMPKP
jgi:hypothetical protein